MEKWFLGTVALLEFLAVGVYFYNGNLRAAGIWFCYATATLLLMGGVK
jgi:hypothetical protein